MYKVWQANPFSHPTMQFGLILQWREARTPYFYQKCISMKVIYLNKNRDKMTSMSPRRQI